MTGALPKATLLVTASFARLRTVGMPALFVTMVFLLGIVVLSPFVLLLSKSVSYGVLTDTIFLLLALFIQLWLYGTIILMVERREKAKDAILHAWGKLWQLFLAALFLFFVLAMPLVVTGVIGFSLGVGAVDITTTQGLSLSILTLFSYAWLLFSSVFFLFVPFIIMLEGKQAMVAIRHSWQRTRGHWAPLFWRYLLFTLLLTVGTALLNLIPGLGIYVAAILVVPLSIIFLAMLYEPFRTAR